MSTLLLILNQLSRNKSVRVLDFGGGTGLHYYNLHPLLRFPENVHWHVVDSARLADIGKPFQEESHRITFSDALPESARFDLLHISSTLHYIEDYPALLEKLLGYEPQWVHLVRLHAGDVPTHVTVQKVRGTDTPIIVPNFDELSAIFHGHSYDLVAKGPVESEDYDSTSFAEDVPPSHRIPHSLICSFIRRDSE